MITNVSKFLFNVAISSSVFKNFLDKNKGKDDIELYEIFEKEYCKSLQIEISSKIAWDIFQYGKTHSNEKIEDIDAFQIKVKILGFHLAKDQEYEGCEIKLAESSSKENISEDKCPTYGCNNNSCPSQFHPENKLCFACYNIEDIIKQVLWIKGIVEREPTSENDPIFNVFKSLDRRIEAINEQIRELQKGQAK